MENKYLPIGSVCTLKGKNKKVMIIGYYSVEYNGNFKIKDYCGCTYPEGLLIPEQNCTFNHIDIETIDFKGYSNEEQKVFSNLLDRLTGNNNDEIGKAKDFHESNDMFLASSSSFSKLLFDENGVVMIADPVKDTKKEENKPLFKDIKFDNNGTVVSLGNETVENPFHKEYREEKPVKSNPDNKIFGKVKFDENGVVIGTEPITEEKKEESLNKIKFDENGVVVSQDKEEVKQISFPKYEFDDNGNVISVKEDMKESKYEFDENGVVIDPKEKKQESKYEFDDNGNVVAVN